MADFDRFTHILTADESNLRDLTRIKPKNSTAELHMWGSYLDNKPIADPYYGGIVRINYDSIRNMALLIAHNCRLAVQEGFERCFQQSIQLSEAFLDTAVGKAPDADV